MYRHFGMSGMFYCKQVKEEAPNELVLRANKLTVQV